MSFILDALRKSEHERQRQTGPGLAEVPVAPPKQRTNVWATAAIALLVINLLAVGVLLLRRAQRDEAPAATAAATASPAAAAVSAPATAAPVTADPTLAAAPSGPVTQSTTPPRPVAAASGRNPLADEVGGGQELEPAAQSAAAAVPQGPAVVARSGTVKKGSVVYAPVPEAEDPPYVPPVQQQTVQQQAVQPSRSMAPAADAQLPGADEVAARGGVPALHLDLHVYSAQPAQRFIFVNSRKYREGDTLAEGPVVEQITPDGAVLDFRGSRFRLSND